MSSSRQLRDRSAGSANVAAETAATRAYLECAWDLARARQEAFVFKLQVENIEKRIKEVIEIAYGPNLTEDESKELNAWRKSTKPQMLSWVTKSEVQHLEGKLAELSAKYAASRQGKGLGVYEAPHFIINCLESRERLDIQRKFDINRELSIMTNPETDLSFQDIKVLRNAAGIRRALYRGCSLIKPEYSVEKELQTLHAADQWVINSYRAWIPTSTARLAEVERSGVPLVGNSWPAYFGTMGYMRLELLVTAPVQPRPQLPSGPSPSQLQSTVRRTHHQPVRQPQVVVEDEYDDDETEDEEDSDEDIGTFNPFPPPAPLRPRAPNPPPPAPVARPPQRYIQQQQQQPHHLPFHPVLPPQPYHPFGVPAPAPVYHPPPPPPPPPAAAAPAPAPIPIPGNQPVNRHGRPQPYAPTAQAPLNHPITGVPAKWNRVRGNTPGGGDVWYYDKLFNRKDSINKDDRQAAKRAREDGTTRDLAIDEMIRLGLLPQGFRDVNP